MRQDPMIVSVSKAIANSLGDGDWTLHLDTARAAVRAMREPTLGMLEAALPDLPDWGFLPDEWQVMIDFVVSEEAE